MQQPAHKTLLHLPDLWETSRLMMRDSSLADAPRLQAIFNACHYVEPWDKTFYLVSEEELAQLVGQSLASDEKYGRFRLQCICLRDQPDVMIGYFHLHHGVPEANIVYMSMFVIQPDYQRQRFGQEVVAGLAEQLARLGYQAIRLDIFLKNWPALRFWIKAGFTTIIEYEGDEALTPTSQASLLLERKVGSFHGYG